jgi:hypothetical protein
VPDEEIAAARKRTSIAQNRATLPPREPRTRLIALPLVAMLVTVALALGFTAGVLFGRAH